MFVPSFATRGCTSNSHAAVTDELHGPWARRGHGDGAPVPEEGAARLLSAIDAGGTGHDATLDLEHVPQAARGRGPGEGVRDGHDAAGGDRARPGAGAGA